jgi:hypothetical protein
LIHSDVYGPSPITIKGGSRYYVSFIDDHTCYYWVYLMKHRFEFFEIYTVTARPNMLYLVRFGPYRPHGFVPGDASPLLSLTPQNAYNMLATSTTNKASYQTLTRRCGILQSTPLMSPTTPSAQPDSQ